MKCKFKKDVEIAVKANENKGAFIHPDNFYEIANNDYYSIEISTPVDYPKLYSV